MGHLAGNKFVYTFFCCSSLIVIDIFTDGVSLEEEFWSRNQRFGLLSGRYKDILYKRIDSDSDTIPFKSFAF